MSVHLLNPLTTNNFQAWFAQHEEFLRDCSRMAIVAVHGTDDQATSQVLYFNMNELWVSWAAAKMADVAAIARAPIEDYK